MLKRYMHKRERYFAMLNDNRVIRPFEWGTEFITDHPNGDDPRELFSDYSKRTIANSDEFFFNPEIKDYKLHAPGELLSNSPPRGGVAAASSDGVVEEFKDQAVQDVKELPPRPSATPPFQEGS